MTEHCWVWVTEAANIPPREGRAVSVAGRELAIFNLGDGRFTAVDGRCPHKGGPLADGIVSGDTVICPLHAWKVCLTSGQVERPTGTHACVTSYPVRLDRDTIVVGLPAENLNKNGAAGMKLAMEKDEMAVPGRPAGGDIAGLHDIGSRIALADPLHAVLSRVVSVVTSLVQCDSCFIYVLEDTDLVLRASKTPHPDVVDRLKLRVGQGITGWVAEHREPVAVATHASDDRRFQIFSELPEDRFEAFLSVPILSRGKIVGVINLQHQEPHDHTAREIQVVSTVGFLVGAEIERARLEAENSQLTERLEERKVIDRAKGILQRDLRITEEEAYVAIQRQARQRRRSKKEIAEAIIIGDELRSGRDSK